MKQRKAYDCGPAALMSLFEIHLGTSPAKGTSPNQIETFLGKCKIPFASGRSPMAVAGILPFPPFLINYWKVDDGHWGVVVKYDDYIVWVYDPEDGRKHKYSIERFVKNWHSKRYGEYYYLKLLVEVR